MSGSSARTPGSGGLTLEPVTVVRIYVTEGDRLVQRLVRRLHDHERIQGVTVFRGISGFGRSGQVHSSDALVLSLDLPVVIEFFDRPARVREVLGHLAAQIRGLPILTMPGHAHIPIKT